MPVKVGNDTLPLGIGWIYQLTPGNPTSEWVELIAIIDGIVYGQGVDNVIATWSLPDWHFDDIMVRYRIRGWFLITEDSLYAIASEDGETLLGQ